MASQTTLGTVTLRNSSSEVIGAYELMTETSSVAAAHASTIAVSARGSRNGSSPCTFTYQRAEIDRATSATRSVPVRQSLEVIATRTPSGVHASAMRESSVATTRSSSDTALAHWAMQWAMTGLPPRSASALPGNLVEAYLAGMTTRNGRVPVIGFSPQSGAKSDERSMS